MHFIKLFNGFLHLDEKLYNQSTYWLEKASSKITHRWHGKLNIKFFFFPPVRLKYNLLYLHILLLFTAKGCNKK